MVVRTNRNLLLSFVAVLLLVSACARPATTSGSSSPHNVITPEELSRYSNLTLYEAIRRLRPSFFRTRDVATSTNPVPRPVMVYLDDVRTEGLDALRNVAVSIVKEVRFLEPQQANVRYGTSNNNGGAIVVTTR